MQQSKCFERAQAIVLRDKLAFRQADLSAEITRLIGQYFDCQSVSVQLTQGNTHDIVITITASKVKPLHSA